MSSQAIRTGIELEKPGFDLAPEYDRITLLLYLTLVCIGLVMVASASIGIADQQTGDPLYFTKRPFLRILLSVALLWIA